LIATSPSQTGVSLSPSFVASLSPVEAIGWSQRIWAVPGDASITAGTFLFDENALLAGVATTYGAGIAIVPSDVLLAAADDLMKSPPNQPGDLGIEVQELTPSLSIASGAESGVVVSWVDPNGAANRLLMAGDVITAADGMAIMTTEQWRVRAARTAPKQTVMVTALRRGQRIAVTLAAPAAAERSGTSTLGLTLRLVPRVGSEVVSVDRGSAAATSGIEAGDIITAISSASAPSPAEVRRAFASAVRGAPLIVALTHGSSHRVVAVPR
jgi:S1-C subfamily serine protease